MGSVKKTLAAVLVGAMLAQALGPSVLSAAEALEPIVVHNGIVEYRVNRNNGRFTLKTADGIPGKSSDNDKKLLFEDKTPDTSFTTFRIDGKDYIYGNDYQSEKLGGMIEPPEADGTMTISRWKVDDIEVTQKLHLITDATNPDVGNLRITYDVTNTGTISKQVGTRILLDTMMGSNDASPMVLGSTFVTNETVYEGKNVPGSWKSADEKFAPNVVAFGMLSGWDNLAPDKMVVAHWQSISKTKWDFTPNGLLNFTSAKNRYESADSAVGLYWQPKSLGAGESVTYETYYGIGSISDSYSDANFNIQLKAPSKLTINENYTAYQEDQVKVEVELDNSYDTAENMENVRVEIGFEDGLALAPGQPKVRMIEMLKAGERQTLSFLLKPTPQQSLKVCQYGVTVTCGDTVAEASKYIVLPSLKGEPPKMQMTEISPEILYYRSNQKKVIIKGSDFDSLKADRDWEMSVRGRNGEICPVRQGDVYIEDNSLTINIDPDFSFSGGRYDIVLKTANYGTLSKSIEMSYDKKYDRKEFGTMTIGNVAKEDGKFEYGVKLYETEQEMENLSEKEKNGILLTVRGDIVTYELDGVRVYELGPGTIINNAIKYMPPDSKPKDTIKLRKQGDTITMTGYGTLSIADYSFHYGTFTLTMKDGTEYTLPDPKVNDDNDYMEQAKDDEEGDSKPVTIKTPNNEVVSGMADGIGKLLGFQVHVNDIVIGEGTVSLGGSISLAVPFWAAKDDDDEDKDKDDDKLSDKEKALKEQFDKNKELEDAFAGPGGDDDDDEEGKSALDGQEFFKVNLEEMRYGINENNSSYLVGFLADGKLNIDDNLIPKMKFGLGAELALDSIHYPGVYADMKASVKVGDTFSAAANVILVFETGGNTVPDTVELKIEGDAIRIPLGGVGFLTKLGGGVYHLYDQLKGKYKYVPPITVKLMTGYVDPTTFAFELGDVSMEVGGRGIDMQASDGKIVGLKVLNNAYCHVLAYDTDQGPAVDIGAGLEMNLLGIVRGNASVWFIYDPTTNGIFGPVNLGGKAFVGVFLPDWLPLIGGLELLSVGAEVSTYRVFLGVRIIGIPISVGYYWADKKVKFFDSYSLSDEPNEAEALIPQADKDNALQIDYINGENTDAQGAMVYGGNLRKTYSQKANPYLRSSQSQHVIPVKDQAYGLFDLTYEGETLPEIHVTDPKGGAYALKENENYMVQTIPADQTESGVTEHHVFISLTDPMDGNWTITSNRPMNCDAMDVLPIPEIKDVHGTKDGESTVTASWNANGTEAGDTVSLYLAEASAQPELSAPTTPEEAAEYNQKMMANYDSGVLIAEGIPVGQKQAKVTIPDYFESGDYQIRAVLNQKQVDETGEATFDSVSSAMSTETFHYVNPNTPKPPTNVTFGLGGDGLFRVAYDKAKDVDGYILEALDEDGKILQDVSPVTVDPSQTISYVGGVYEMPIYQEKDGTLQVVGSETKGIFPEKTYRVSVRTYKEKDGVIHTSDPVISEPLYLPKPNPAKLLVDVNGRTPVAEAGGMVGKDQMSEPNENIRSVLINTQTPELKITSDQAGILLATVNGEAVLDNALELAPGCTTTLKPTLREGENKVVLYTKNQAEDYTTVTLMITVDSVKPELMLNDTTLTSKDGIYHVVGTVESNTAVYIGDGEQPIAQENGTFDYQGQQKNTRDTISVRAVDAAGNETTMEVDVIPSELAGFQKLILKARSGDGLLGTDETIKLKRGDTLSLEAYGVGQDGREYRIDNKQLTWSILAGNGKCTVDDSGTVTALYAGNAVIGCEFAVTENYTFEQTADLEIGDIYEQPTDIRISSETFPADLKVGETLARLSVPGQPTGVRYTYEVSGPDGDALEVKESSLVLKKPITKQSLTFTVRAQGTHVLDRVTQNIGTPIEKTFTLKRIRKITAVQTAEAIGVYEGTPFAQLNLPKEAVVTLNTGESVHCPVTWREGAYQKDICKTYYLQGVIEKPENTENSDGLMAQVAVTVKYRPGESVLVKPKEETPKDQMISKEKAMASQDQSVAGVAAVPFQLQSGYSPYALMVYAVDQNGTATPVVPSWYDTKAGKLRFRMQENAVSYLVKYEEKVFADTKSHWAKNMISYLAVRGIVQGTGNDLFAPDQGVTRAAFLKMLLEASGEPIKYKENDIFKDVKASDWYAPYVYTAYEKGIVKGKGQGMFGPNDPMTREEMLVMFYHYLQAKGVTMEPSELQYTDASEIAPWAQEEVKCVQSLGLITGKKLTDGSIRLDPKAGASRGECAAVITRWIALQLQLTMK